MTRAALVAVVVPHILRFEQSFEDIIDWGDRNVAKPMDYPWQIKRPMRRKHTYRIMSAAP
jgi:hypothetical protein